MRRAAPWAAALLLTCPAAAQDVVPGLSDVPAGGGTLRVRVEHAKQPDAVAGLPVVLYALPPGGEPGLRGGVTDARGEVVFAEVSSDPGTPYLVGVRFDEVPFGERVRFAPGETEARVVLRIAEPTADTGRAQIGEIEVRVETACEGAQVIESWEARNPGERVIGVREAERDGRAPIFETRLPEDARGFAAGPSAQGLAWEDDRLRFWGPLHPGTQEIEWSYGLPAGARWTRRLPERTSRLVVRGREDGPTLVGPGLGPARSEGDADGEWRVASLEGPFEGPVELTVTRGERRPGEGLRLGRAQLWVELDGAALRVDERYEIEREEEAAALGPLLCVPLPEGAQELRFSSASLGFGLSRDPSGALAVRGPFPPGRSVLTLRYLVPADPGPSELVRRFAAALPLLSVYVADTGLRTHSERLHRRRPVLTDDRTYMHFEGFGIAPDETVALSLRPLPAPRRAARPALAAFLVLSGVVSLAVLAGPLLDRRAARRDAEPEGSLERESLEQSLRDLDHDFETGKLAAADYESFRKELRERLEKLGGPHA